MNLYARFLGHNPTLIVNALLARKDSTSKGEYESTAQYNLRRQREEATPYLGFLTTKSMLAFVVPRLETRYDADSSQLSIFVPLEQVEESDDDFLVRSREMKVGSFSLFSPLRGVVVSSTIRNRRTYFGRTGLGATTRVTYAELNSFSVSLDNWNDFQTTQIENSSTGSRYDAIKTNLQLNPEIAAQVRNKLGVLMICKLVPPFASYVNAYKEPTLSSPIETKSDYNYLYVMLLELWVFDRTTGEIYQKVRRRTSLEESVSNPTADKPVLPALPATPVTIKELPISLPKPAFPREAKEAGVGGEVSVRVTIDETGKVIAAVAISGHSLLRAAAEAAAQGARFSPSTTDGRPVKAEHVLVYNFIP